jgi:hypothetical protein
MLPAASAGGSLGQAISSISNFAVTTYVAPSLASGNTAPSPSPR